MDADGPDRRALVDTLEDQPSLAAAPLPRETPEVGAECVSSACSNLSGGRRVKPASLAGSFDFNKLREIETHKSCGPKNRRNLGGLGRTAADRVVAQHGQPSLAARRFLLMGLFKVEMIHRPGPWCRLAVVEIAQMD